MALSCRIGRIRDDGLAEDRDEEFALVMDLIDFDLEMDLVEAGLREESGSLVLVRDFFLEHELGLVPIRMMELGVHLYTTHFSTRSLPIELVYAQSDVCLAALRNGRRTQVHLHPVGSDDPMLSKHFDLTARHSIH